MDKLYFNPEIWGGIECTINRVKNQFFDQLEEAGHYQRLSDIDDLASLGITKMRYPILWERHQPNKDTVIDWTWTREALERLKSHRIDVIAGLVHHGSGPKFTSLNDPAFASQLADYSTQVAQSFPRLEYYTPVNEPLTTARFSGLYGLWFPHHRNARSFLVMLLQQLKAVVLSMEAIRKINPSAKLVQTEDLGKTYSTPPLRYQANFENERRWLTYDLLCGRFNEQHRLWKYCTQFNIPKEDFYFFLDHPCPPDIFGFNHYVTSERFLDHRTYLYPPDKIGGNSRQRYADVEAVRAEVEEETGIKVLLNEAWKRYGKPMAVTEVHLHCHREEQLRWFKYVYEAACSLHQQGVGIQAITTWAMLGSYGWNKLLTEKGGEYEPGAFDLRGGKPRPTALAHFIRDTARKKDCSHHLAEEKGWWERSSRIIYGEASRTIQMAAGRGMPVLIIGRNGTLGKAFARLCEERCIDYHLLSRQDCNISNPAEIEQVIDRYHPWAIINAAGYVRVDDAEREAEDCFLANTTGPANLAKACNRHGLRLLSFSSDLVFDGRKSTPYLESDLPNPLNIYGKSKAEAEKSVLQELPTGLIVRTSAFFGPWDEYNFVHFVRKSLSQFEEIKVASDILISPTYVPHLVHASLDLLIDGETGIWHLANQGSLSWAELASITAARFNLDQSLIRAVGSEQIRFPAARPRYSVLGSERGLLLPPLDKALQEYFQSIDVETRKVA